MDINKYKERKEAGLLTLEKRGLEIQVIQKRFDPETGIEIEPERRGFNPSMLEKRKFDILEEVAKIDEILDDIRALPDTLSEQA